MKQRTIGFVLAHGAAKLLQWLEAFARQRQNFNVDDLCSI